VSKPFVFEKPLGMRDTLPLLYETKKKIRNKIERVIQSWGYQFIETPTLEYYDTVGSASSTLEQQLFKLLDQQGKTLVLRPDMTAPIARVAGSSLKEVTYPLRLAYDTQLFRAQQREGGRPAEYEQIGVELIGDGTGSADAEVISLMVSIFKETGLKDFQVAIGHVGFINSLFVDIVGNQERADVLRRYLYERNYVGFKQHVKGLQLSSIDKRKLLSLLELRGGKEAITKAYELLGESDHNGTIEQLASLWDVLESYGVTDHVKIDFTLVRHINYYTGIVFEAYGSNLGYALSGGGRYDQLLEKFNRPAQATGFGIRLDHLIEALGMTEEEPQITCVIFSPERRAEAIELAAKKRREGERVVLQDITGVGDLDAVTERFSEVVYCIGKAGKGVPS
jgi:ATP phosphoribosyltransferase regulatory subunit